MKKLFVLFVFTELLSVKTWAYDAKVGGIYYNLKDGQAEVTFKKEGKYVGQYSVGYSGDVVIPNKITYKGKDYIVTTIGSHAFCKESAPRMTSLFIPGSITKIERSAFINNSALKTIIVEDLSAYCRIEFPDDPWGRSQCSTCFFSLYDKNGVEITDLFIPDDVPSVNIYAFYKCKSITSVTIPYNVNSIRGFAFYGCENLETVIMSDSVKRIAKLAFGNCKKLSKIKLSNNLVFIGEKAFWGCSGLTSVTIPNSVTNIENAAFSNCGLTSLAIPPSVTSIGDDAFYKNGLTSITFSNSSSLTSIGASSFSYNHLKSIKIPNSVTSIEELAFCNNEELETIQLSNNLKSIGSGAFCYTKLSSITFPQSLRKLGHFSHCHNLSSVIFNSRPEVIDKEPFKSCENIKSVTISPDFDNRHVELLALGDKVKIIREAETGVFANKDSVHATDIPNLIIEPNSVAFIDADNINVIQAGKNSAVRFLVKNVGRGVARACKVRVSATGTTQDIKLQDVTIGNIMAGVTETVEIPIIAGMNAEDGKIELSIQVDEPNGFGTDAQFVTINTRAFEAPMIQIADYTLTAERGQTLRKKVPFDLQLLLQNTKRGTGEDVTVSIDVPENVLLIEGREKEQFASLTGGEIKSLVYSLIVNNNYASTTIPVKVHITEKYGKYAEDKTITLKLDQSMASTKISVDAAQREQKDIAIASLNADVDVDIPAITEKQQNTFAVIIANEHYNQVAHVPYAQKDGEVFGAYCRNTLGIPQQNIRTYSNATYGKMLLAVKDIQSIAKAYNGGINVIFYYAGHGVPNEISRDAFLLPVDADGQQTEACYPVSRLYKELGSLGAKGVVVFMDACFSGSRRGEGMLASARGVALKANSETPQGNMVVFSAASGDETAYPYKEKGHGLFTYFLLKKLQDSKGDCTLGELSDYIQTNVRQQAVVVNRKSQTPTVMPSAGIAGSWRSIKLK